jgi:hypothetical protein
VPRFFPGFLALCALMPFSLQIALETTNDAQSIIFALLRFLLTAGIAALVLWQSKDSIVIIGMTAAVARKATKYALDRASVAYSELPHSFHGTLTDFSIHIRNRAGAIEIVDKAHNCRQTLFSESPFVMELRAGIHEYCKHDYITNSGGLLYNIALGAALLALAVYALFQ